MNTIYLEGPHEHRVVWRDGFLLCPEHEATAVRAVTGEYYYPPIPQEAIMATTTEAMGALASFMLAFPDRDFLGFGPDFPAAESDFEDPERIY